MKGGNKNGSFAFLVDGNRVAFVNEWVNNDPGPQGTGTINLHLTAGQLVQVENHTATYAMGTTRDYGYHSWFTGFLLHAD